MRWLFVSTALALVAMTGVASAQEERSDARTAYDDAAKAYEARDFKRAAEGFAKADALAPNALALKLALAAAVQADDPVLAEELAVRAESRDASADVQEMARNAHRLAKGRVGKIEIACAAPSAPCVAQIGARELRHGQTAIAARGPVTVTFTSAGGKTTTETVIVAADTTTRANEPAFAPAKIERLEHPADRPRARSGLDPAFVWIGAGLTVALAGVTVVSGLDANARHDDFVAARTTSSRDTGQAAELRTNVLLGSTIVVAAVTGVIGLWFTRWGGSER